MKSKSICFIKIFIFLIILTVFLSILIMSNDKYDNDNKINNIDFIDYKTEIINSSDISRSELFDIAYNYGYKKANKNIRRIFYIFR